MSRVQAQGGPHDQKMIDVYGIELRIPLGWEYGWRHACGHASLAVGVYTRSGEWLDADRDVQLDDDCSMCEEYGRGALL